MKTNITAENPFGVNRYGFLWEKLNLSAPGRHLDYGAYDGAILKELARSGAVREGVGVDLNKNTIESQTDLPENITLRSIEKGAPLPFDDESFDSVSILDVIEHIHDQKSILCELNRVLKAGGKIIITVPRKHVFSLLDVGNFKFIFPRLHKAIFQLKHSKEEYRKRYVECANGLFGDVEVEKMWHQHFSNRELAGLLQDCGFTNPEFDGSGLFTRPLILMSIVLPFAGKLTSKMMAADLKRFQSMNLFCVAEKT